ncbi:GNAT family N-acetyltransferase [Oceanisphaera pacifica]|uniref:GNAT family N-acetyltransferase n=1 Tax=Oceanisphaera pacifica TaxID=2818389 RepID=A0ABS3NGF3_9GAMM|nr:GNAT family N-acetyltransferase [Oceanisphaera pacifica]MBO1519664.1 GNAT family N-acetyltransferase [Oceanisphaera pacifica]
MSDIQIVAYDSTHSPAIRAIREAVFMQEQGVSLALEFDGRDDSAIQVLVAVDGQYVGTGRMLDDGHIGRIAILKSHRGQGLGAKVVQALVAEATRLGYQKVYLGAQTHAVDFYAKLGFTAYGDEFMDAGIPHLAMEQFLA